MPGTNTQTLTGIFGDVADAIRAKDGTSADIYPADFATKIAAIPSGSGGFDYTGLSGVKFAYNTDTSIDLSTLDTSGFTSMKYMFYYASLTSIDVSSLNTSNVTDMSYMFAYCIGLTSIDVSSLDTSNVTDMSGMFSNATGLTSIDVSSFNTSSAENISYMFRSTYDLTSLDLSNFDTSAVTNMSAIVNATHATSVNFQSFTTGAATAMTSMLLNSTITDVIWAIDSTTVQPLVSAKGFDKFNNTVPTDLNIWVRDSLKSSYASATNWNRYSACFKPISQLPAALQALYNIDPNDYQ